MMIHLLPGAASTAAALQAERTRMEVIGQNIANAQMTRGLDGKPYQRQQVVFESVLARAESGPNGVGISRVQVAQVKPDPRPARTVYQPGHPDADASGFVAYPNVSVHEEMADLIAASRTYEANLAVIRNARVMLQQTLALGKRT